MELLIEKLLESGTGSSILQSILLMLIWLNVRSLKEGLAKLEVNHEKRIVALEGRVDLLEAK